MSFARYALAGVFALLAGCASQPPSAPEPAPLPALPRAEPAPAPPAAAQQKPLEVAALPPFDGERKVVEEPLRGVAKIDRTVSPDDLWQRIRHGFGMPDLGGPLVKRMTAQYAASPEYLQRIFDRSRLYLYHIVEEIEKRNLPTEIALLPMVESAFNPMAYSRARASGLWQFIPGTGKRYKLQQSWWYDERRDVVESTNAALDYLTFLYEMHGDWQLALASYNWGEGAVKRAVERNRRAGKPTDYSSLRMPKETRHYIPKLQALKNIIANPQPYGIDLDPIPNEPFFAVVDEAPDMDVQLAAKLAEMPVEEFMALNPGFSRPLIRASGAARIVLPADKVQVFRDNLARRGDQSLISWQIYHPRKGETIGAIAKKFKFSIDELKRVNGIAARSWKVPRVLVVPMRPDSGKAALQLAAAPAQDPQARAGKVHIVKAGDTLSSIGALYRVSVEALRKWNGVSDLLQIGQKIHIRTDRALTTSR